MSTKVLAVVTAVVSPENEADLVAAFREMSAGEKPDGFERSELLRGRDGTWLVHSLWRDREAMAAARQGGNKPAVLALLDRLGCEHSHALYALEHAADAP